MRPPTFGLFLFAFVGCGSPKPDPSAAVDAGVPAPDASPDGAPDGAPSLPPAPAMSWAKCTAFGDTAECATVSVPLDWSKPDGKKIDLFVARTLAKPQPARAVLFYLAGGPGGSARYWGQAHDYPGVDVYAIDHRGTGESRRLSCPKEEANDSPEGLRLALEEVAPCAAYLRKNWGDDLKHIGTSDSARDVYALAEWVRSPGQRLFLYGSSYGSYLANRYMTLFPDHADAVAIDAILTAGNYNSYRTNKFWFDPTAHKLMDACAADSFCSSKLGPDPYAAWQEAVKKVDDGGCPVLKSVGVDGATMRLGFELLTVYSNIYTRNLVPALIHRVRRCGDGDINALFRLVKSQAGAVAAADDPMKKNWVLNLHVHVTELPDDAPFDPSWLDASGPLSSTLPALLKAAKDANWPAYHEPLASTWGTHSKPILITHGEHDFLPFDLAKASADHWRGPNQTFLSFPRVSHGTLATPWTGASILNPWCGNMLLKGFFSNPSGTLDTTCVGKMPEFDFSGASVSGLSTAMFGTSDPWEGVAP